jgi:protoporphyrinogen oxidase
VASIDAPNKTILFADGSSLGYNRLLSTLPLDLTLRWVGRDDLAERLTYSSSHIIGIGLRGVNPHDLKCWLYYPEDDCPFYRCTVFSHYAEKNVPSADSLLPTLRHGDGTAPLSSAPQPGPYWSLMFEVSESREHKPVDLRTIVEETIRGALNTELLSPTDEIVSIFHRRLEHGYPTPCLKRDGVLQEALPMLKSAHSIWSRGRFGSYKYEVGNQDHSCMLGVEAADNILYGAKEFTLFHPSLVSLPPPSLRHSPLPQTNEGGKKNTDMKYTSP